MQQIKRTVTRYPLSLITLGVISYITLFNTSDVPSVELFAHFDKVVHFLMYAFLCSVLWYEYYKSHIKSNEKRIFWGAIIAPILFSGMLEVFQTLFTDTRTGDIVDFLFNTLGVVFASFVGVYVIRPIMRRGV